MRMVYAVWSAAALLLCSLESFRVLQSTGYRPQRGYFKILYSAYFFSLIAITAFSAFWTFYFPIPAVLCGFYTLAALPLGFVPRKCPLKFTKRVVRMLVVQGVLLLVGCYFAPNWIAPALPFAAVVSWAVCLPLDCLINRKYLRQAQEKLKKSNLTVIAVTGSYGKTTVKNMLSALLVDSVAPQGSCNTPLGIAAFINNTDLSRAKYLVLEYGARRKGDIAELCRLFPPQAGIVTGVCPQHMSTFKTMENLIAAKSELPLHIPTDGFCVLADKSVEDFAAVGDCKKYIKIGVKTKNIKLSPQGTEFDISCQKNKAHIKLSHIAPHIVDVFAECFFVCLKLGQSFEATVLRSGFVKQTEHRLEISYNGNFYIIDDSYNASIKGVESCCAALGKLVGYKIAISQGIVEGGKEQRALNEKCAKMLGDVCDVMIILGKYAKQLYDGAKTSSCQVIIRAKNLNTAVKKAQQYVTKDCFLLFQNDLPDVANI